MSKKFLEIPMNHSFYGDFYRCNETGDIFRADNLEIATTIAFNYWLREFDNLGSSCRLATIEPGKFTVEIEGRQEDANTVFTVEWHGPKNMFEIEYVLDHCQDPEFRSMLAAMETALSSGHPSVRISKNSGRIMFSEAVEFPRWKPGYWDLQAEERTARLDEFWFPWEHRYLSTDLAIARLQMQIAGIQYQEVN